MATEPILGDFFLAGLLLLSSFPLVENTLSLCMSYVLPPLVVYWALSFRRFRWLIGRLS